MIKRTLLAVLVVLSAALTSVGLSEARPARAQDLGYSITVSGVGTAAVAPDIATVELGVEVVNTSLARGLDEANTIITQIGKILTSFSVAPTDVQTNLFTVTPVDRVDTRGPTGTFIYRLRITQRVTIRDLAQTGNILNGAVRAGANVVANLNYGINNIGPAEQRARAAALADAKKRADELAESLGVRLGDPLLASETITSLALPPALTGNDIRGATLEGTPPPNVGQLIVRALVQVTYTIRL